VPAEQLQFFDQGFFHGSVVVVSVGVVALGGVVKIPLVDGLLNLLQESNRNAVGDRFPVHPDAPAFVVVFDNHDCFFPVGCYIELMGLIEINGDLAMKLINTDYIVSMSKDLYSDDYSLVLATPDGRYSARICLSDSDYQKVLNELRRKAHDGELPA